MDLDADNLGRQQSPGAIPSRSPSRAPTRSRSRTRTRSRTRSGTPPRRPANVRRRGTRRLQPNSRYPEDQFQLSGPRNRRRSYYMRAIKEAIGVEAEPVEGINNPDAYSFQDAYKHPTRATQWNESIKDEFESIDENGVWELCDLQDSKMPVITCRWVFKTKLNPDGSISRYKSRLVARGFTQKKGVNFNETFAPVAKFTSLRLLFAMASQLGWEVHQMDAKTAFLCSEVDNPNILVAIPEGFREFGQMKKLLGDVKESDLKRPVLRLKKALYGLKQSPRLWYKKLTDHLSSMGFKRSELDHSVWARENSMVAIYVDDILVFGPNENIINEVKNQLKEQFKMVDSRPVNFFLGLQVLRKGSYGFGLSQEHYVKKLLKEFDMEKSSPIATPLGVLLRKRDLPVYHQDPKNTDPAQMPTDVKRYQRAIGSLMYLMLGTRPDIAFAISHLSQFCANPSVMHWQAVKRLLRYLQGTASHILWLNGTAANPEPDYDIYGFCDADWAADAVDRKSCGAYLYFYRGCLVSWASKKQTFVATSTMEAEYVSASNASKEGLWLREMVSEIRDLTGLAKKELKSPQTAAESFAEQVIRQCTDDAPTDLADAPVMLFVDNQAAIKVAQNPEDHARSKHIHISYHFVRQRVALGQIRLQHVSTKDMVADYLTKPLPKGGHTNCRFYSGIKTPDEHDKRIH